MDKNKETFDTWDKIALAYQDKFMDLKIYDETYDQICEQISTKNAKLLDIGCGPGNITKYILSQRSDFKILGIDIAPNMIELAKKNNPNAEFRVMDCREIGQLEEKYEGIIAGFCLPYLNDEEVKIFLKDAHHLLHKNGFLYFSFVEGSPDQSGFKKGTAGRVYFHFHLLNDIKSLLTKRGFKEINVKKIPFDRSQNVIELHTILTTKKI